MSTINLEKIDKLFVLFVILIFIMAGLTAYSLRGVFSAIVGSFEVDQSTATDEIQIDYDKLNEAENFVYVRPVVKLNVRD